MSDLKDTVNAANSRMNMKVNPLEYPSIPCDNCGCECYEQAMIFKKIPGLVLGAGNESQIYPIPVFICKHCGVLMSEYRKDFENAKNKKEENNPLIIT